MLFHTWNPKQPFINGCFNWMIPNFYIGNGCFTKHPFFTGCLGFQVDMCLVFIVIYFDLSVSASTTRKDDDWPAVRIGSRLPAAQPSTNSIWVFPKNRGFSPKMDGL